MPLTPSSECKMPATPTLGVSQAGGAADQVSGNMSEMRTPEMMPPPLSCSTVDISMSSRRKKKLFTEKLGPQEFE